MVDGGLNFEARKLAHVRNLRALLFLQRGGAQWMECWPEEAQESFARFIVLETERAIYEASAIQREELRLRMARHDQEAGRG